MTAAIIGALKALPLIAAAISELALMIKNVQDDILENYIEDIKSENDKVIQQIKKATTNEELKKLIRDLNTNLHR